MSFDDIQWLQEIERETSKIFTRSDFIYNKSPYLHTLSARWKKSIVQDKDLDSMRRESETMQCKSLYECPCAQRAVFIQNLYRNWCKAHHRPQPKPNSNQSPLV